MHAPTPTPAPLAISAPLINPYRTEPIQFKSADLPGQARRFPLRSAHCQRDSAGGCPRGQGELLASRISRSTMRALVCQVAASASLARRRQEPRVLDLVLTVPPACCRPPADVCLLFLAGQHQWGGEAQLGGDDDRPELQPAGVQSGGASLAEETEYGARGWQSNESHELVLEVSL